MAFDSEGYFELHLRQNLDAVLFPMMLDEKDVIIAIWILYINSFEWYDS